MCRVSPPDAASRRRPRRAGRSALSEGGSPDVQRLFEQVNGCVSGTYRIDQKGSVQGGLRPDPDKVIDAMLEEACRREHGRWQWRGFHLAPDEFDQLANVILKAHLAQEVDMPSIIL